MKIKIVFLSIIIGFFLLCGMDCPDQIPWPIYVEPWNPGDESIIIEVTPTLQWTTHPDIAAQYHLMLDDDEDFSSPVIDRSDIVDEFYLVSGTGDEILTNETDYYWKVRAQDEAGAWWDWSDAWSFTPNLVDPPIFVTLQSPADGSTVSITTPTFEWTANLDIAAYYHLQIDDNSDFSSPVLIDKNDITDNSYTLSGTGGEILANDTTYYWRVRAQDGDGNWWSWSEEWDITTINDKIIFVRSDGNDAEIYIIDSDGTNEEVLTNNTANDNTARWFPDKSKIIYISDIDGDYEIFTMDPNGSNITQLTFNTVQDYDPSVSWDKTKVIFSSYIDVGNSDVFIMDIDGSNQVNLTTSSTAQDRNPSISPDGTKIVFWSQRDGNEAVFLMDSDGSNQTNISNSPSYYCHPTAQSWSPDGSRIVFDKAGFNGFDTHIYTMNPDGTNVIQLTSTNINQHDNGHVSWSYDGQYIVFRGRDPENTDCLEVFIMDVDGSNKTKITSGSLYPLWVGEPSM